MQRPIGAEQNAALPRAVGNIRSLRGGRGERFSIQHELNANEEAQAAHITDQGIFLLQGSQAIEQVIADMKRVGL